MSPSKWIAGGKNCLHQQSREIISLIGYYQSCNIIGINKRPLYADFNLILCDCLVNKVQCGSLFVARHSWMKTKMAATKANMFILTFVLFSIFCGLLGASSAEIKIKRTKRDNKFSGNVHFNNPKLLNEKMGYEGHHYYKQDPVDPKKMGGIYIRTEANRLALRLRILSREEMRVPSLQVGFSDLQVNSDGRAYISLIIRIVV